MKWRIEGDPTVIVGDDPIALMVAVARADAALRKAAEPDAAPRAGAAEAPRV